MEEILQLGFQKKLLEVVCLLVHTRLQYKIVMAMDYAVNMEMVPTLFLIGEELLQVGEHSLLAKQKLLEIIALSGKSLSFSYIVCIS